MHVQPQSGFAQRAQVLEPLRLIQVSDENDIAHRLGSLPVDRVLVIALPKHLDLPCAVSQKLLAAGTARREENIVVRQGATEVAGVSLRGVVQREDVIREEIKDGGAGVLLDRANRAGKDLVRNLNPDDVGTKAARLAQNPPV